MTFDDVSSTADQEFELQKDTEGMLEYATKLVPDNIISSLFNSIICYRIVTFNNVNHLSIHFPSNFGEEHTTIYYIGLKGEFSEAHRHGVTICNYELKPNMSDHKNPLEDSVNSPIS